MFETVSWMLAARIAALNAGRRLIGLEQDAEYFGIVLRLTNEAHSADGTATATATATVCW